MTKDASEETALDFLIFEGDGFQPVHKKINKKGDLLELGNFQFRLMHETSVESQEQEIKRKGETGKLVFDDSQKALLYLNYRCCSCTTSAIVMNFPD